MRLNSNSSLWAWIDLARPSPSLEPGNSVIESLRHVQIGKVTGPINAHIAPARRA